MLISKDNSLLLIIDIQERLAPATLEPRKPITNSTRLLKASKILEIESIITEQYPKGLGPTMFDLREFMKDKPAFEKVKFSCFREKSIKNEIKNLEKKQIILTGVETHICVLQTAIDLKTNGYDVFVVIDACSSRKAFEQEIAIKRLTSNNIDIVTTEMVLFEWLEQAGTKEFREISKTLIK